MCVSMHDILRTTAKSLDYLSLLGVHGEFLEPVLRSSIYTFFHVCFPHSDWDCVSLYHVDCWSWTALDYCPNYHPPEGIYEENQVFSIMRLSKNLTAKCLLVELRSETYWIQTHFQTKVTSSFFLKPVSGLLGKQPWETEVTTQQAVCCLH